ncbi:MAG: caspase family protein [Spirochaetales bacterium]|nr:caspase family protein [Spirochaetales bacterium]
MNRKLFMALVICLMVIFVAFAGAENKPFHPAADGNENLLPEAAKSNLQLILILADDYEDPANNQIAAGVRSDGRTVRMFVELLEKQDILKVKKNIELTGRQVTRTNILNAIKNAKVGKDDVLMVYYSGHGAVTGRGERHMIFPCVGQPVYRDELDAAIKKKNTRLAMLITDACSSSIDGFKVPPSRSRASTRNATKNLKELFACQGYLSLTAASELEMAMGPDSGGFFTTAFIKDVLISNPPATWKEVLTRTQKLVMSIYDELPGKVKAQNKEISGQTTQRPMAYSMPAAGGTETDFEEEYIVEDEPVENEQPYGWEEMDETSAEETGWDEGNDWWGSDVYEDSPDNVAELDNWDYTDDEVYSNENDTASWSDQDWENFFQQFMKDTGITEQDLLNMSEEDLTAAFEKYYLEKFGGY